MLAGIVVLRNRDTFDPDDGGPLVPIPQVPGTWTLRVQGRTGWVYAVNPSGLRFWWYTAIDGVDVGQPTKIVGVTMAVDDDARAWLQTFAADNDNAWTLPELRADGTTPATTIKAAWRELAGDDDPEPNGTEILRSTVAGFDYRTDAERYATVAEIPES